MECFTSSPRAGRFQNPVDDALCIDQTNVKERSQQVAQMAKIYSQASKVVAWIGGEFSHHDRFAIDGEIVI